MFTIKEVANSLEMSTQAIYKQKQELIDKGFMKKNENNQWEITDNGFNYLQDKKVNFIQQHHTTSYQPVANQPKEEDPKEEEPKQQTIDISTNESVVNLLINQYKEQLQTVTNQLQEMKEQRDYFKAKFEEKDNLCNQYMNSHLLPPVKEEDTTEINNEARANQEKQKQGLFKRLFNKGN